MVADGDETTATPQRHLTANFHHIINQDDYIPFVLGDLSGNDSAWNRVATTAFETIFDMTLPSSLQNLRRPLGGLLKFWMSKRNALAQFGCVYLLQRDDRYFDYSQIRERRVIPQAPDVSKVQKYHSITHYTYCLSRVHELQSQNHNTSLGPQGLTLVSLPSLNIEDGCYGAVSDKCVAICITVETLVSRYFVSRITFDMADQAVEFTSFEFTPMTGSNEKVRSDNSMRRISIAKNIFARFVLSPGTNWTPTWGPRRYTK